MRSQKNNMEFAEAYGHKTILVTGGAGAIGGNLVKALSNAGAKSVLILDNLSSAYTWNIPHAENIAFIKGDIRSEQDLNRVFEYKPTIIFHLAAFFANQNSVDHPLENEEVNGLGMVRLLQRAATSKCVGRFVYANSEGGAYGSDSKLPYKEHDISLNLSSPYYVSKMAGEAYCNFYHTYHDLPTAVVRLFNSYGPGEVPGTYRNVIPNFIYWALQGQALPLTGNESMARDFVYVADIVEGLMRAGCREQALGRSINIATGKATRIWELAEMINQKTSSSAGTFLLSKRKWDTRESILGDASLCEEILGFRPGSHFEDGLDRTIRWFRENWNHIAATAEFSKQSVAHGH